MSPVKKTVFLYILFHQYYVTRASPDILCHSQTRKIEYFYFSRFPKSTQNPVGKIGRNFVEKKNKILKSLKLNIPYGKDFGIFFFRPREKFAKVEPRRGAPVRVRRVSGDDVTAVHVRALPAVTVVLRPRAAVRVGRGHHTSACRRGRCISIRCRDGAIGRVVVAAAAVVVVTCRSIRIAAATFVRGRRVLRSAGGSPSDRKGRPPVIRTVVPGNNSASKKR